MWKRRKEANDRTTHKEEAGLECRFIDGVVAVGEGDVPGIEVAVGLASMDVVVVEVSC